MPEGPTRLMHDRLEQHVLYALLETLDLGRVGLSIVAIDVDPPEYLFLSAGAANLLGYTVEELVQIPVWELFPPDALAALRERQQIRSGATSGTSRFEIQVAHRDGSRLRLEITSTRVIIAGRPAQVTFMNDVS